MPRPDQGDAKYYIFESIDGGRTWVTVGTALAKQSEAALRAFYGNPLPEAENNKLFVAASENSFKARRVRSRVQTSITDAEMPEFKTSAPQPEPIVAAFA